MWRDARKLLLVTLTAIAAWLALVAAVLGGIS